jgi:hypothetical protein
MHSATLAVVETYQRQKLFLDLLLVAIILAGLVGYAAGQLGSPPSSRLREPPARVSNSTSVVTVPCSVVDPVGRDGKPERRRHEVGGECTNADEETPRNL